MSSKKKAAKEKPLDKMTAKELRELAKEIPGITGAHGMNKPELISSIKQAKGIAEVPMKKSDSSVRELKVKLKTLKAKRVTALESDNARMALIYRRRITKLKKKTRR
ncbi:MAG: transcription termination factor Rho [Desulfobacteraceae bacterium]|nr:MAG: transcription termination factor Rho [Desulfobacteraceae bacterium]